MVRALAEAGMDAARLNFSHGTHEDHAARAALVREVQAELGRPLALIADLQGPKLRIGDLPSRGLLRPASEVVIAGEATAQQRRAADRARRRSRDVLQPGHDVLIDDGLVRLRVEEVDGGRARCRVVVGGEVRSNKGVNLPGRRRSRSRR